MWVDILSLAAIGTLAACLIYITRRQLRRHGLSLPRWLLGATIGACMIGYSIWNEYSWFDRIRSGLPASVAVVSHGERSAVWAPWSYAWPVTVRFIAMDSRQRVQSTQRPGLVVAELLLVERWQPTRRIQSAFDCHHARRADLVGGARIDADGSLSGTRWQTVAANDPMLQAACAVQAV